MGWSDGLFFLVDLRLLFWLHEGYGNPYPRTASTFHRPKLRAFFFAKANASILHYGHVVGLGDATLPALLQPEICLFPIELVAAPMG